MAMASTTSEREHEGLFRSVAAEIIWRGWRPDAYLVPAPRGDRHSPAASFPGQGGGGGWAWSVIDGRADGVWGCGRQAGGRMAARTFTPSGESNFVLDWAWGLSLGTVCRGRFTVH